MISFPEMENTVEMADVGREKLDEFHSGPVFDIITGLLFSRRFLSVGSENFILVFVTYFLANLLGLVMGI